MHVRSSSYAPTSARALTVALLATVIAALLPLSAAEAADPSDYEQVVDITYPFTSDTPVTYRNDYDASRGGGRNHQSIDMMVAMNTPIYAAQSGYVSWLSGSESGPPSYGWMVRIAGDDGRAYAYVHLGAQDGPMSEAYASGTYTGARIERGQLLGWAGCSGSASCGGGEHLHFEIHDPNVVDPYDYHDHERINPYFSVVDAEARNDYPDTEDLSQRRFPDVDPSGTHGSDIETLADSGITRGCGETGFCPERAVTREQMASFLKRGLDLPAADALDGFEDVDPESAHAADIAALAAAGITSGCGEGVYCPSNVVTRQQMASFLVRALDLDPGEIGTFSDVDPDSRHAADIAALAAAGITRGCGGDQFCPDAPVTRQQMASFLVRALDL